MLTTLSCLLMYIYGNPCQIYFKGIKENCVPNIFEKIQSPQSTEHSSGEMQPHAARGLGKNISAGRAGMWELTGSPWPIRHWGRFPTSALLASTPGLSLEMAEALLGRMPRARETRYHGTSALPTRTGSLARAPQSCHLLQSCHFLTNTPAGTASLLG